jgi:hypothetical protein
MTALNTQNSQRNYFNAFVDPSKFNVIRPLTQKTTIVRFLPEFAADGSMLPAFMGTAPDGSPDISNLKIFQVAIAAGEKTRFTGITDPEDVVLTGDVDNAFAGTWIRLKNRTKTPQDIPAALLPRVMQLMTANQKGQSIVCRPTLYAFMQCIVLVENDTVLAKPAIKQLIALSPGAVQSLKILFRNLASTGRDPFSPEQGISIRISGSPPDKEKNKNVWTFTCEEGAPIPMKPEMCRKLWVPWEGAFRRYKQEQLFQQAMMVYGRDIVEFAFPECTRLYPSLAAVPAAPAAPTAPAAAPVAHAAPVAPAAPAVSMALDISDEELAAPPSALGAEPEAPAAPVAPVAPLAPAAAAAVPKAPEVAKTQQASLASASPEDLEAELNSLLGGSDE